MSSKSSIICGPETVVYINGKPFAQVSSIDYSISSPYRDVTGIDTLLPLDTVPQSLSFKGSMNVYMLRGRGGLEGEGISTTWESATRGKYFSLLVLDRATSDIIFESRKNRATGQQFRLAAKSIATGVVQFTGLFYSNNTVSPS
jgi:hypothetical protein